jgi:hypothetical protein
MRTLVALVLSTTLTLAVAAQTAPVVTDAQVRENLPNDYLRISFVPASVQVTSLARPRALRGFATATPMFTPALRVADLPAYSGLVNSDENVLVAMRCQPQKPETVDAVLATWPGVFTALQRDIPLAADACAAASTDVPTQLACFARGFTDKPGAAVPLVLDHALHYAAALFDEQHTAQAQWLRQNYGIFPAFSGLGFSVKDSYYLDTHPMTAQQILVESASPEYILKNVSLADAGCRCVRVAPYAGRSAARLDPAWIWAAGGEGVCKEVKEIPARAR